MRPSKILLIPFLVLALGPALFAQPAERWSVPVERLRGAAVVALHDGGELVLVEDSDHGLTALDAATGSVRWFVLLAGPLTQPATRHGDLLALTSEDWLLVVDAKTGRRDLQRVLDSVLPQPPVASEPMLYLAETLRGKVSAVDLDHGRVRWTIDLPGGVTHPLEVGPHGGAVLAACGDGTLRALPAGLSAPRGEAWGAHTGSLAGPLVVADGKVVSAGLDRRLTARHVAGGSVFWERTLSDVPTGGAVVAGGTVAVSTVDGVSAFRLDDGSSRWTQEAERVVGAAGDAVFCLNDFDRGVLRRGTDGEALLDGLPSDARALSSGLYLSDGFRVARIDP
jgi:outer membrane protein assembly factor BamB